MKADYDFEIEQYLGSDFIVIEDLDLGNKSVTNDIENVVDEISKTMMINPAQYFIIYRDSDGVWDGWDFVTKSFVGLRESNWLKAADKYLKIKK